MARRRVREEVREAVKEYVALERALSPEQKARLEELEKSWARLFRKLKKIDYEICRFHLKNLERLAVTDQELKRIHEVSLKHGTAIAHMLCIIAAKNVSESNMPWDYAFNLALCHLLTAAGRRDVRDVIEVAERAAKLLGKEDEKWQ